MNDRANPLRISSESLNLDDIISDLNENQPSTQQDTKETQSQFSSYQEPVHQLEQAKPKERGPAKQSTQPTKSSTSRLGLKSKAANNKENTQTTNQTKATTAKAKQAEPLPKEDKMQIQVDCSNEHKETAQYSTTDEMGSKLLSEMKFQSEREDTSSLAPNSSTQRGHVEEAPFYMNSKLLPGSNGYQITDEDIEGFQRRLDTMIINFRSETMNEFVRAKKQVLSDQNQAIDGERRRCNTMLSVKQNEIEQLKEQLGQKQKMCEELSVRCEILALWAGKGKTIGRLSVLKMKSFLSLKQNAEENKHNKLMIANRLKQKNKNSLRRLFQGWNKQYREWKIQKNKEDFEKAVKLELQSISAQYSKEIEQLRDRLSEANLIVDKENRNKQMMQENLKKAFMRGVCALNFEAMNILSPNDQNYQQAVEREMERQVQNAMTGMSNQLSPSRREDLSMASGAQSTLKSDLAVSESDLESERKFMMIGEDNYKKIESKDSQWKPAPIYGREISGQVSCNFNAAGTQPKMRDYQQLAPSFTESKFVLPSHFAKPQEEYFPPSGITQESIEVQPQPYPQPQFHQAAPQMTIPNQQSSLPCFTQTNSQNEGRQVFASQSVAAKTPSAAVGQRKPSTTATSRLKK